MSERLTWDEIVKKYPCNCLGLTDVIFENNDGINVASAVVKYDNENMSQLTERLLCDKEDIFVCHTDPDSFFLPLGVLL